MLTVGRLRERQEVSFFLTLPRVDPLLAGGWYGTLALRGVLPAVFGIGMGRPGSAVRTGGELTAALAFVGAVFVLLQVLAPNSPR